MGEKREAISRRAFLRLGSAAAALAASGAVQAGPSILSSRNAGKPNIVLIITDQQHSDTISAQGCRYLRTPALDWLAEKGVSFTQSYCTDPLCSPSRSSILTGRMPSETGVHVNGRPIRTELPNLGEWFSRESSYETVYAGKWHLPRSYTQFIPGFRVLNTGLGGLGYVGDTSVALACEGYLRKRSGSRPFLLVASFLQPHDICEWLRLNLENREEPRYPQVKPRLPELPGNFDVVPNEPLPLKRLRESNEPCRGKWGKAHWRYYLWSYYRHVEMVDAEIGRVLETLNHTGYARDTLIVFTADHGEGLARHQMVRKTHLYEASAKVPLIISWPGHVPEGETDAAHLISGLDIVPTLCDYTAIKTPGTLKGKSLRPILQGNGEPEREFIVSEVMANRGRMVRSQRYKYIVYDGDRVEQLFDMEKDPGEMQNLASDSSHANTLHEHRKMLQEWEKGLQVAPGLPHADAWWR